MISMKRLFIEQTVSTLGVDFDPQTATMILRGESYPENAFKFFAPLLEWLNVFLSGLESGVKVTLDIDIVYFNSSSSKALMNVFDMLDAAAKGGVEASIFWRYHVENEIARECGEEFQEELGHARFEMVPYEDAS